MSKFKEYWISVNDYTRHKCMYKLKSLGYVNLQSRFVYNSCPVLFTTDSGYVYGFDGKFMLQSHIMKTCTELSFDELCSLSKDDVLEKETSEESNELFRSLQNSLPDLGQRVYCIEFNDKETIFTGTYISMEMTIGNKIIHTFEIGHGVGSSYEEYSVNMTHWCPIDDFTFEKL